MTQQRTTRPGDTWPQYQEDYCFEMSSAHRKPSYEIGTPSISWHLSFWNPVSRPEQLPPLSAAPTHEGKHPTNYNESESFQARARWVECIEKHILHIYDRLLEHRNTHPYDLDRYWSKPSITNLQPIAEPHPDELRLLCNFYTSLRDGSSASYKAKGGLDLTVPLGPGGESGDPTHYMTRYETVHLDGVWNSMPLDIRFEVSGEYFTVTTTVDFSRMRPQFPPEGGRWTMRRQRDGEFRSEFWEYAKAIDALTRLTQQVNSRKGRKSSYKKDLDIRAIFGEARYLYFDLWNSLKNEMFSASRDNDYIADLGDCFGDFRNLSLQCDLKGEQLVLPWRFRAGSIEKLPTGNYRKSGLREEVLGHSFDSDDIEWVDSVHPILLALEPSAINYTPKRTETTTVGVESGMTSDPNRRRPLPAETVEYTFTKFSNGRCIYGSGFGPQLAHRDSLEKRGKGDPLTFIFVFGHNNQREMGRLLQTVNTLGTLRIAALHDLRITRHLFDHVLSDVEHKLETLQVLVSGAFTRTYSGDFETEEVERSNEQIGRQLADVHEVLDGLDLPGLANRGPYRTAHGGWVPFRAWRSRYYLNRFRIVARSLKSTPVVGYQPYLTFVEQRLSRAYSSFQRVAKHYSNLREKETRLRREWMGLKSEQHQKKIVEIQDAAEVLFFLVLFPYYTSHAFDLAVHPDNGVTDWVLNLKGVESILRAAWLSSAEVKSFLNWISNNHPDQFLVVSGFLLLGIFVLYAFRRRVLRAFLRTASRSIRKVFRIGKRK